MILFWLGLALMCFPPVLVAVVLVNRYLILVRHYVTHVLRIFVEKPLFVIPRGEPRPEAEEVCFPGVGGLRLHGCYFRAQGPRRGVILFAPEFGANCWSCWSYCDYLLAAGFDVFAFEPRNQGASDAMPGYEPLQWVTEYEVEDTLAALAYLRDRPDADPRGVGFFGMSKGGGAGLVAASRDGGILCCATDGAFPTYSTLLPYMRYWFGIYHPRPYLQSLMPTWYVARIARYGLRLLERERHCRYVSLELAASRLKQPLLMIHGEADNYIKVPMARAVFDRARGVKEFWVVPGAKHNGALHQAGEEYRRRVLQFFEEHLAEERKVEEQARREGGKGSVLPPSCHSARVHTSVQGDRP